MLLDAEEYVNTTLDKMKIPCQLLYNKKLSHTINATDYNEIRPTLVKLIQLSLLGENGIAFAASISCKITEDDENLLWFTHQHDFGELKKFIHELLTTI